VEGPELSRFAVLRERLVEVVNDLLRKCREPTMKMANDLINIELSYINTAHPDFIGGGGALGKFFDRLARTRQTEEFQRGEQLQQQQTQQQQQQQQMQQQQQQHNQMMPSLEVKQGSLLAETSKFTQSAQGVMSQLNASAQPQPQSNSNAGKPPQHQTNNPQGGASRPGQQGKGQGRLERGEEVSV
jgi:ATP-dependent exoDNAse (exonuclease V) beta subunit